MKDRENLSWALGRWPDRNCVQLVTNRGAWAQLFLFSCSLHLRLLELSIVLTGRSVVVSGYHQQRLGVWDIPWRMEAVVWSLMILTGLSPLRGRNISTREPRGEGAPLPGSREITEQFYQGAGGVYIPRHDFIKKYFHLLWADIINLKYIDIKKIGRGGKNQHSPHSVWITAIATHCLKILPKVLSFLVFGWGAISPSVDAHLGATLYYSSSLRSIIFAHPPVLGPSHHHPSCFRCSPSFQLRQTLLIGLCKSSLS